MSVCSDKIEHRSHMIGLPATPREVTAQVSTVPAPASTAEAVKMVLTGLSYLAAADPTAMAAQAQAECLQALEQGDAIATAARARILAAFTAGQGYSAG
jgi:hypothetical protein